MAAPLLAVAALPTMSTQPRSDKLAAIAPRMGLGMAALGRPGYINLGHGDDLGSDKTTESMRSQAHAVLDEAFRLGVRYIDCARSYGLSEDFVASWLATRPEAADLVVVGSKCVHATNRRPGA